MIMERKKRLDKRLVTDLYRLNDKHCLQLNDYLLNNDELAFQELYDSLHYELNKAIIDVSKFYSKNIHGQRFDTLLKKGLSLKTKEERNSFNTFTFLEDVRDTFIEDYCVSRVKFHDDYDSGNTHFYSDMRTPFYFSLLFLSKSGTSALVKFHKKNLGRIKDDPTLSYRFFILERFQDWYWSYIYKQARILKNKRIYHACLTQIDSSDPNLFELVLYNNNLYDLNQDNLEANDLYKKFEGSLRGNQKELLKLMHLGYSPEKIGEIMNIKTDSVYQAQSRLRKKLRPLIAA